MEDEERQEPWEALDVDDSVLSSFLKSADYAFSSSEKPILRRCSRPPLSQTLASQSQKSKSPSPLASSPRLIPGPAGAVQSAMLRRNRHNQSLLDGEERPVPTQEYLRRVVESGNPDEDDDDFACNPWLCALDFISREGKGTATAPLSSIKNGVNGERVAQVIAIIKSSTQNGLGDMMVTLKDPTGTIGASIHHKVFTEGEFGKDISVGAVLVLQKVAVFSPSRSTHYMNVTLSNLVKVISKDSGPPLKQAYPASIKHTAPAPETCEKSWMPRWTFSPSQEVAERTMNSFRQTSKLRGSTQSDKDAEKGNAAPQSSCLGNGKSRTQNDLKERESLFMRMGFANGMTEVAPRKDTIGIDKENGSNEESNPCKQTEGGNTSGNTHCIGETANLIDDQESSGTNGVNKKSQPAVSRTTLPQWTDEQLDMLMAFD
ncbi:hypothetical protein I3760_16G094200 [Carya illinoinensis]|uniref:Homologous recombination OB-fold protein OB-fold domain-containing protein n=1 Tax=Carya illinoinensis TaxID=32201 RepID=A0A922A8I0_CARIL|nr:hypothetical protein I3760_16G094200 [Carya illinoinensis]KAG6673020.1 hypothetical protein I3842_16G089500 [Carya illinoinensis]